MIRRAESPAGPRTRSGRDNHGIISGRTKAAHSAFGEAEPLKNNILSTRHQALLEVLKKRNFATVAQLSKELYVSEITIRRDLKYLESMELLRRSHGGALAINDQNLDISYELSILTNPVEKKQIAAKAVSLIEDGSTVFLDASSSSRAMIPYLTERKELFVFTHGLENALQCANYGLKTFCAGGMVKRITTSCVGPSTLKMLENVFVDYVFFSSRGITDNGLITHQSDDKCRIVQQMMKQGRQSYLLCDSSKANILSTFTICRADELTGVIVDRPLPFEIPNLILP